MISWIPREENTLADEASREADIDMEEWGITTNFFNFLNKKALHRARNKTAPHRIMMMAPACILNHRHTISPMCNNKDFDQDELSYKYF